MWICIYRENWFTPLPVFLRVAVVDWKANEEAAGKKEKKKHYVYLQIYQVYVYR
jgi:hypothetical protein